MSGSGFYSADCQVCGSLWRRGPLSAPRPVCHECREGICGKCEQVHCFRCGERMHESCAVPYGEDLYCTKCAAVEMEIDSREIAAGLLAGLTLEEKLVASLAVANHRKAMVA